MCLAEFTLRAGIFIQACIVHRTKSRFWRLLRASYAHRSPRHTEGVLLGSAARKIASLSRDPAKWGAAYHARLGEHKAPWRLSAAKGLSPF